MYQRSNKYFVGEDCNQFGSPLSCPFSRLTVQKTADNRDLLPETRPTKLLTGLSSSARGFIFHCSKAHSFPVERSGGPAIGILCPSGDECSLCDLCGKFWGRKCPLFLLYRCLTQALHCHRRACSVSETAKITKSTSRHEFSCCAHCRCQCVSVVGCVYSRKGRGEGFFYCVRATTFYAAIKSPTAPASTSSASRSSSRHLTTSDS